MAENIREEAAPSSQLVQEDNAEETTTATSATKLKEFVIYTAGAYHTKFNLGCFTNFNGYAQIYVNGAAKGSARVQTANGYTICVETIAGLKPGDLLQLYAWHTNGTASTSVGAFSISASWQKMPTPITAKVN